ncbi:MAG: hypothetical protein PHQ19_07815 [Candidatus Krumholzibacteria bacterium]|nr:hypothetical protein [Candidatus Krumholzibacteria bacterium]
MTSGRMCAPEDIKERLDDASFERFEVEDAVFHVQESLLEPGTIELTIADEGSFAMDVRGA